MFGRKRITHSKGVAPARGFDSYDFRLGDELRGERATMGKSLMDVQRELRIKASLIAAIENADLDTLGSPSFIPGYVRSYARYLGMDPDDVFARFCRDTGFGGAESFGTAAAGAASATARAAVPQSAPVAPQGPERLDLAANPFARKATPAFAGFEPGALGSLVVLAALVGGLGYGGWLLVREVQRVQVAPVEQEPMVVAQIDPLAPPAAPDGADPGLDPAARADALNRLYRPRVLETPILQARDAPIATLPPGEPSRIAAFAAAGAVASGLAGPNGAAAEPGADAAAVDAAVEAALVGLRNEVEGPPPSPEAPAAPQVVADAPGAVVLVAARESWVRVRDADGATLFEGIMAPGDTWEAPVTELPPSLDTGNAGGIYMAVDGQPFGPVGADGAVVRRIPLEAGAVRDGFALADLSAEGALERVVAELGRPDAAAAE